jgi:hypothetical protein
MNVNDPQKIKMIFNIDKSDYKNSEGENVTTNKEDIIMES